MRDRSIDVGRGLLVILMLYGHVLQFFGDGQLFPQVELLINAINVLVFPGFVFLFGRTTALAYLRKPYKKALPGMARTMLRTLVAFYLSGIAYRTLREGKALAVGTVRRVLQLVDIPGWSEFLVAFALYMLVTIALFPGLRQVTKRSWLAAVIALPCLACCCLPYERITAPQLSLFIGGTQFAYFPVVQYMPYFLAGIAYASATRKVRLGMAAVSVVCSAAAVVWTHVHGLPSRFPPHLMWILLPAAGVAALSALSHALCTIPDQAAGRVAACVCQGLSRLGGASLYYLLGSNLILFTLAGRGMAPQMSRKSVWPWTQVIQSPLGAASWTLVMILALAFVASLAGRSAPQHKKEVS